MAKRKKHATYDSKETKTVLGLLSLLLGLFFAISVFTVSGETNIFTQAKNLFGQSTIFTSLFLFCLGLHYLGSNLPFTQPRSLIAQAFLIFLIPALLTSFGNGPFEGYRYSDQIDKIAGGRVGYFIVYNIMQQSIGTEPSTRLLLFLTTLVFLPIALSLSVSELVEKGILLYKWLAEIMTKRNEELKEEPKTKSDPEKPATFGDFNKLLVNNKAEKALAKAEKESLPDPKMTHGDINPGKTIRKPSRDPNVEIKEGEINEDGLQQETLHYPGWQLPPLHLLIPYKKISTKEPTIEQNAKVIEQTLRSFGIGTKVVESFVGPSVVQYALDLDLGTKVEKVVGLSANLALALGVDSKAVRIDTIPETTYLGIEIPRANRDMVRFKELMDSSEMKNHKVALPVPIGKDIDGSAIIGDIQKMPHLLIAGATGSGKSVLTNSFITSLLMQKTPDELRLILVDPKQVEFSDYNGIAHLLTPVITDMDKVVNALKWAVTEMERRYSLLAKEQVRNIQGYNEKKDFAAMPYIVIVIDEMADMMMTGNRVETETSIVRLAQKARAVGIHLILATQRPSVNVITGIIKANIPGRVGMSVTSSTDSRVILDRIGAESLMGRGDLLYKAPDKTKSQRLQGANIEQDEVTRIVDFIKAQAPEVEYVSEILEKHVAPGEENDNFSFDGSLAKGSLIEQSIRIAVQYNKGSSSFLQRKLNIGFNKAAQLVEELEELGVVGPQQGAKPREVLISDADEFIAQLKGRG